MAGAGALHDRATRGRMTGKRKSWSPAAMQRMAGSLAADQANYVARRVALGMAEEYAKYIPRPRSIAARYKAAGLRMYKPGQRPPKGVKARKFTLATAKGIEAAKLTAGALSGYWSTAPDLAKVVAWLYKNRSGWAASRWLAAGEQVAQATGQRLRKMQGVTIPANVWAMRRRSDGAHSRHSKGSGRASYDISTSQPSYRKTAYKRARINVQRYITNARQLWAKNAKIKQAFRALQAR